MASQATAKICPSKICTCTVLYGKQSNKTLQIQHITVHFLA